MHVNLSTSFDYYFFVQVNVLCWGHKLKVPKLRARSLVLNLSWSYLLMRVLVWPKTAAAGKKQNICTAAILAFVNYLKNKVVCDLV